MFLMEGEHTSLILLVRLTDTPLSRLDEVQPDNAGGPEGGVLGNDR